MSDARQPAPISPPPYRALIVEYAIIAVYALGAGIYGVYTLKVVSGEAWETLWPALLFVSALLALVGVIRSYLTSKAGWEVIGTLALLALLAGYVLAIAVRCIGGGDPGHLFSALLPVAIAVFPSVRLVQAARGVKR